MAGGSFDQQADAANRLSGSLQGVEANAIALAAAVGTLKTALHALSVSWAMKEIELTAQAFYKLRLSLGVTTKGAQEYTKAVTSMTKASVTNRRALVGMFEELRKSSGLIGTSNKELAILTTRLQKEFPQATRRSAEALAQMSNESVYFQTMMSKSTDAATAFAMANAKWGPEYARIMMAARGETSKFANEHRSLLTVMAETKASVENASQSMSEAFKVPTLGVLGMVKGFADLFDILGRVDDGQLGKALGPIVAAGAMFGSMKIGQKFTSGLTQAKSRIMQGIPSNLGSAVPMKVIVTNPVLRVTSVGASEAARQNAMMGPVVAGGSPNTRGAVARPTRWQQMKALPGRAWSRIGGMQGAAGLMMGATMVVGQYQAARQGDEFGWGNALGAAGSGAMAGGMVGGPIGALVGAIAGLTAAIVANTIAIGENVTTLGESAQQRLDERVRSAESRTELQRVIASGGPTPSGQRRALQKFYQQGIIGSRESAIAAEDLSIKRTKDLIELQNLHEQVMSDSGGSKWTIDQKTTERLEKLGVNVTGSGGWKRGPGQLQDMILERMKELEDQAAGFKADRLRNLENIVKYNQELVKHQNRDLELTKARAAVLSSVVQLEMRGYTYGAGPKGLTNIQQQMFGVAAGQRLAAQEQSGVVMRELALGGADFAGDTIDNRAVLDRLRGGKRADFLRLLGSGRGSEFMAKGGEFFEGGATQQELASILASYENQEELAGKINAIEQMRADAVDTEVKARFLIIEESEMLLNLEQQRLDTQIQISSALKQPLVIQAQLVERQINTTQRQIQLEETKLAKMRKAASEGIQNAGEIEKQTLVIEQLYGQLASQVDYIRRSWEEVFTMQSMNLPSGSYILPTMTGLMEKGPTFAPYTPAKMEGGRLAGQGTYESIMGYGKASAFGQLQERLAEGMQSAAGSHFQAASRLEQAAEMLENAATSLGSAAE